MTICLGKSSPFGFLCVFREHLSNFVCVLLSRLVLRLGVWDVIVLIPDHCLSIYSVLQCRYMMSVTRSSTMNFFPWRDYRRYIPFG